MANLCFPWPRCLSLAVILLFPQTGFLRADQIEMQNGDRYVGTVISLTPDSVVLQSQMLGKIIVPRSHVALISMGTPGHPITPATSAVAPVASTATKGPNMDLAAALRQLGADTNAVEQIRKQFLQGAGPQANDKFNDLLDGLSTGKIDLNNLRAQAKSAADQLRALKKDSGGQADDTLDAYLSILDNFLAESGSSPSGNAISTNASQGITTIR